MGKKSLIKSTTKKKKESGTTATPKAPKKSAAASASKPRTKKVTGGQPAPTVPANVEDPRGLLFRGFPWYEQPAVTFPQPSTDHIAAPPFIGTDDPAEAQRLQDLLLNRRHTMEEIVAVAEPPVPVIEEPVPAEPVDPVEVLFRKFPSPELPVTTFPKSSSAHITAPPFISVDDPAEAQRLQDLLLNRRHTMEEIVAVAEPPIQATVGATAAADADAPVGAAAEPGPVPPAAVAAEATPPVESEPAATPSYSVPPAAAKEPADPIMRYAKYAALGFALLIAVLLGASYSNSTTCYLNVNNGRTELWKGCFSPTGKMLVTTLKDFTPPDPAGTRYKLKELYPVIFNHYLALADDMATTAVTPDFQAIQANLTNAAAFAIDEAMRSSVGLRLNRLSRMVLMYQADVAINTGDEESIAAAAQYLAKALEITTDETQAAMIQSKLDNIGTLAAALKSENAAPNPEE